MILLVFEDPYYLNFLPLTYTRSVSELMVGIETLLEGVIRRLKVDRCHLLVRDYLSAVTIKRWRRL
ncbi:MAG: putative sugar nucleotidyl transferase [Candidatus Nezhaarchaeales archaeon]